VVACAGSLAALLTLAVGTRSAAGGRDHHGPPVSNEVRHMLRDVHSRTIEATIHKLVSFGTRSTLSSTTDPNRGIGAATQWVYEQLQQDAAASGGRMTVEKQSFVVSAGSPRIPVETTITNVIATLHGTQPESAARTYVVSGHLDSRVTDVLNGTSDAPGADDDGSGVAAVLELARVMAKHQFDATIVFAVFSGERLRELCDAPQGRGNERRRDVLERHHRQLAGPERRARHARPARLRRGPVAAGDACPGRHPADDGRRQRHAPARARPLRAGGRPGCDPEDECLDHLPARPLPRGTDDGPSLDRATPGSA
jgi:peptidase M28-like protein